MKRDFVGKLYQWWAGVSRALRAWPSDPRPLSRNELIEASSHLWYEWVMLLQTAQDLPCTGRLPTITAMRSLSPSRSTSETSINSSTTDSGRTTWWPRRSSLIGSRGDVLEARRPRICAAPAASERAGRAPYDKAHARPRGEALERSSDCR